MRWIMNGLLSTACCLSMAGMIVAQTPATGGGGAGAGAGAGTGGGAGAGGGAGTGAGAGARNPTAGPGEQAGTGRAGLLGGQAGTAGQNGQGAGAQAGVNAGLGANAGAGANAGLGAQAGLGAGQDWGITGGTGGMPDAQTIRMLMSRLPVMIALDVDGNGAISTQEVQNAPLSLSKLDRNADGVLTMNELLPETMTGAGGGLPAVAGAVGNPAAVIDPAQMAARMMTADVNNDGFIDKIETPARMQQMFARADVDRDGRLSREEVTQLSVQLSDRRDNAAGRNDAAVRTDAAARTDAAGRNDAAARVNPNDRQAEDRERAIRARQ